MLSELRSTRTYVTQYVFMYVLSFYPTVVVNRSERNMPASEFKWNSTSTPIFEVYGTKRKASDADQTWPHNPSSSNATGKIKGFKYQLGIVQGSK